MNAWRSRRKLTCEISISGTSVDGNLRRVSPLHRDFQQRVGHIFLTDNQIDEQRIERDEFEPEVPNRLADKQERKQNQHAYVGHQQSPPLERWASQTFISRLQPDWNLAAEQLTACLAHLS